MEWTRILHTNTKQHNVHRYIHTNTGGQKLITMGHIGGQWVEISINCHNNVHKERKKKKQQKVPYHIKWKVCRFQWLNRLQLEMAHNNNMVIISILGTFSKIKIKGDGRNFSKSVASFFLWPHRLKKKKSRLETIHSVRNYEKSGRRGTVDFFATTWSQALRILQLLNPLRHHH